MSTSPDTSSIGTLPVDGARNAKPEEDQDGRPQDIPSNVTSSTTTVDADAEGKPDGNDSEQQPNGEHEDEDGKTDEESESEEGSSGSGEEEEEEGEDDDDEEPALKYERITGEIPDLFKKDSASALTVSNKLMVYLKLTCCQAIFAHIINSGIGHACRYHPYPRPNREAHQVVQTPSRLRRRHLARRHRGLCRDRVHRRWGCLPPSESPSHVISCLGQVVVHSLSTPENYSFDMKRPMRTVAMEPNFAKKSSRAFVCGGLSGSLVMREKGWLGHKETTIHSGEGPIWQVRWRGQLIAWANDTVSSYSTLF
jgi:hypothetical protein